MKKCFIIANWKSFMTLREAKDWLEQIAKSKLQRGDSKQVIICAPFTLLSFLKEFITKEAVPLILCAEDISQFGEGAYTGEINGKQIKEFADYVLIGHSERRKNFNETDDVLLRKVTMANSYSLVPVYCIQGPDTKVPPGVSMIAYEPVFAIGTGNPDTPKNAENVATAVKNAYNTPYVLYGGSVNAQNVRRFTGLSHIDGVLVGKASLDAKAFIEIINNA